MREREREEQTTVICRAEGQLPLKQRQHSINNTPQNLVFLKHLAMILSIESGKNQKCRAA